MRDNFKQPSIHGIGVSKRGKAQKKMFQEIMSIRIIYVDYFIRSTTKLIEIMSEFSKVVGYKINIQNPILFLHTSNEQS